MRQTSPLSPLSLLSRLGGPWRSLGRLALLLGVVALVALTAGVTWRVATGAGVFGLGRAPAPPRVTHDLVVQELRAVAKLVSTETTIRDVVVYEQTRYLATKRALLVVTGRVMAGVDLDAGADVRIDHDARRITVSLPPARVLGVDVVDVRTYDERAGLLNPFRPEDRDAIQRQVRAQLVAAAERSGTLAHADSTAGELLKALLARDGYSVEIVRPPVVRRPGG